MFVKMYMSTLTSKGDAQRIIARISGTDDLGEVMDVLASQDLLIVTKMFPDNNLDLHVANEMIIHTDDVRTVEPWDADGERQAKAYRREKELREREERPGARFSQSDLSKR